MDLQFKVIFITQSFGNYKTNSGLCAILVLKTTMFKDSVCNFIFTVSNEILDLSVDSDITLVLSVDDSKIFGPFLEGGGIL